MIQTELFEKKRAAGVRYGAAVSGHLLNFIRRVCVIAASSAPAGFIIFRSFCPSYMINGQMISLTLFFFQSCEGNLFLNKSRNWDTNESAARS